MPIWRAQRLERHLAHVVAVDQHLAAGHVVEARDQVDDAALAAAGGAEDGHRLARLGLEADVLEHRFAAAKVAEADIGKLHSALHRRQRHGARLVRHLVVGVQDLVDAIGAGAAWLICVMMKPSWPRGKKTKIR